MEKYGITANHLYNWDEKGFIIGHSASMKRVLSREAFESGRISKAIQDGSREFVSLLACISAAGRVLPPALIYKGDSGDLRDTWLENWMPEECAYFAASPKGWSSDALGLDWLTKVFDRHTKESAGRGRRLLLVDGHSSHVNWKFIQECDRLRILVMVLPAHSTHRLQPLDVSLFSPLAVYYSNNLNDLINKSFSYVSMNKRMFWSVFWPSWNQAFTESNIASAWEKSGIWPYNPDLVLSKITIPKAEKPAEPINTPMTCRAVRRIQRAYNQAPASPILEKVFRANDRLAAQHSVDQHVIHGLRQALAIEKRRQKKGKQLNLLGNDDSGPQFFGPDEIEAARVRMREKEEEEAREQQRLADKRDEQAAKKVQKEEEKAKRVEAAAKRKEEAAEARLQKAIDAQVRKETREAIKRQKASARGRQKKTTGPKVVENVSQEQNSGAGEVVTEEEEQGVVTTSTRTRAVKRPARYAQ
jgi:hypothetical protein